jgi:hypothetical protein
MKLIQAVLAAGPQARPPGQERHTDHSDERDPGEDLEPRGKQRSGIPDRTTGRPVRR